MSKTIVMTGGGTAGHVIPNLALIPYLKKEGCSVEYIGSKNGMEKDMIKDIPYHAISAGKLRRYFSFSNFIDPFRIIAGYFGAKRILKKIRPYAVFSKGGFVTVPVVFAAKSLGIRVVLHESDYTPGLANKLSIPKADKICVSFDSALKHIPVNKGVFTGLPIRRELFEGSRSKGLEFCGFDGKKPVLLIMGGSLGAKAVNDSLDKIMTQLTEKFDVVHIRGAKNMLSGELPAGYRQFGFINDEMPDVYAAADIMLSRAGATAVFEITALKIPALLIPLPKSASRGDQILNAGYMESKGYSKVIDQDTMTEDSLKEAIFDLYENAESIKELLNKQDAGNAAEKVVEVILDEQ